MRFRFIIASTIMMPMTLLDIGAGACGRNT